MLKAQAARISGREKHLSYWVLLPVLLLVGILLAGAAVSYFRVERRRIRDQNYDLIRSVTNLKIREIEEWRAERLADASELSRSRFLVMAFSKWLSSKENTALREPILQRLKLATKTGPYDDAFILGHGARPLLYDGSKPPSIDSSEAETFNEAISGSGAALSDLFPGNDGKVHIDVMAAIHDRNGRVAGVVVLRSDAGIFLNSTMTWWPASSRSAKTILVEKRGNKVVCLSHARFRSGGTSPMRVSIRPPSSPAAQAVDGRIGMFEGTDYRGKDVLAYLSPVPGTPWFMVGKMDTAGILVEAYYRGGVVVTLVVLFIAILAAITAYAYRHRQAAMYRELYQAEVERGKILGEFRTTLYSIGDAVITTDTDGVVRQMNPAAEHLTGWSESDALNRKLHEIFHIINEETGAHVESPVDRVLREGVVIGLANHTLLITKEGNRFLIADSGAPIHDRDGNVTGVVLIFRDQTKERAAERELKESELRLKRAERVSRVGHYVLDIRSGTWSSSEMLDELCGIADGFKRDREGWLELVHPDDRPMVSAYFLEEVIKNGKNFDGEFRIIGRKDKKELWVHALGTLEFAEDGNPSKMFGTVQDVTGRKLAEKALYGSQQMFKDVLDTVPVRVFWKDAKSRYLGCNLSFARDSGFSSPEEIVGRNDFQMTWQKQAKQYRADDRYIMETGNAKLGYEEPRSLPDGVHWMRTSKVPLLNADAQVVGVLGTYEDITERRKAREELQESEEKFRGLVEGSTAAIWIHDGTHILYANPAALKMTGFTFEEISRLNVMDLVHPDFRELVAKRSSERLKGNDTSKHYEYQILSKSGGPIWIDFSGGVIDYRGKPSIIASAYDITERKKLEEQLAQAQKMDGIGRLAGGIAHDYNNMLGVIMGYAELMARRTDQRDTLHRYAEMMSAAATRGAELTRQLLAFARREIISPKPVDLNQATRSLVEMVRKMMGEDVELVFIPGDDLWNIRIDPTQFDQILINLATNARDAIRSVGIVTIETSNIVIKESYSQNRIGFPPGDYVLLSFSDNGRGMDRETLDKIFEPFFTTKPKGQGTGLGLSTVYGIVKQNGGNINVYSEVGVGTTFKIYFPRFYGDLEKRESEPDVVDVSGKETVLIVEDQADLLELARNSLSEYGYKVLTALSPGEAILICQEYQDEIHLLLTDVVMPVMNGKVLRDRIHVLKPTIKTLFMSGYTANVIAHRGILDEGVAIIPKPFTPSMLVKKVHEVLNS